MSQQNFGVDGAVADHNSIHSNARANVLEHLFIGELLKTLWCEGIYNAEVLRSEVDSNGYDLVVECNEVLRYIQLKTSHSKARANSQKVNLRIKDKPGGCVVWIVFDQTTLKLESFLWFGGGPGESMPELGNKVAKHTKGNSKGHKAERPNIRVLNKSKFQKISSVSDLLKRLFGKIGLQRARKFNALGSRGARFMS